MLFDLSKNVNSPACEVQVGTWQSSRDPDPRPLESEFGAHRHVRSERSSRSCRDGPGERGDGERAGEFRLPRGVAVDPSGQKLFVAEQKRVQVLTTQWGVPLQVLPMPGAGTLWGICVSERYAHVVDNFKQTVTVLELCNTGVAW